MIRTQISGGGPPPPPLKVLIKSPKNNDVIDGPSPGKPLIITGTATGDDVVNVTVTVGNDPVQTVDLDPVGIGWTCIKEAITIPGTLPTPGPLTISATAHDGNGKTSSNSINVTINDQIGPQLGTTTLTPPPDAKNQIGISESGTTVNFEGSVTENIGIKDLHLEWSYSGAPSTLVQIEYDHLKPYGVVMWKAHINIPPKSLGDHVVSINCTDQYNNSVIMPISFKTIDTTAPHYSIIEPRADPGKDIIEIPGNASGADPVATVNVRGNSQDIQTGVEKVTCFLDIDTPQGKQQTVNTSDNWASWFVSVDIPTYANHTITITFFDNVGNSNTTQLKLDVTRLIESADPKDLTTKSYLQDLIHFAVDKVVTESKEKITSDDLKSLLYQPFDQIIDPTNLLGSQLINQIVISSGVLRQYIKKTGITTDTNFANKEHNYLQTAYQIMLNRIGTSYEEIRLARGSDDNTRKSLAARLGIDLLPNRPDQLDSLFLQPGKVTENQLETLFGLPDTTRDDPLMILPEAELIKWRRDHLRTLWASADHPVRTSTIPTSPLLNVIIDPDIVDNNDLKYDVPGNSAFDILQDRSNWVDAQFKNLKTKREQTVGSTLDMLRAIVDDTIVIPATSPLCLPSDQPDTSSPLDFLQCLQDNLNIGKSVDAILTEIFLPMNAFSYLMRIKKLAEINAITDSEWDDVYNVLVQVKKSQVYSAWQEIERQNNIGLTSEYFKISTATTIKEPINWRYTPQIRQAWNDTLNARITQESSMIGAFQENIQAVIAATMPILRDALIALIAPTLPNSQSLTVDEAANFLTDKLLIDLEEGSSQLTIRITQAIETLQGLFLAIRTKSMIINPADPWMIDPTVTNFDEQWIWMGSYINWRAAMMVFLFPENILLPSLWDGESGGDIHSLDNFKKLITNIRGNNPRLTPDSARNIANDFVDNKVPAGIIDKFNFVYFDQPLTAVKLDQLRRDSETRMTSNKGDPTNINYLKQIFYFLPFYLALQLQQSGEYLAALDLYQRVYAYNLPIDERMIYYGLKQEVNGKPDLHRPSDWLSDNSLNPHIIAAERLSSQTSPFNPYTRYTIMTLIRCFLEFGDSEFARDTEESVTTARLLYLRALDLLGLSDLITPKEDHMLSNNSASVFLNPILDSLRSHVLLQLTKLRQGRTIAGTSRQAQPFIAQDNSMDIDSLFGNNGTDGLRILPNTTSFMPTPYKYSVLIERSKQLMTISQQIESSYLSSLEKLDAETYNLKKAGFDLNLAEANLGLQQTRLQEASDGVELANRQLNKGNEQQNIYAQQINAGLNDWENSMITNYQNARKAKIYSDEIAAAVQIGQNIAGFLSDPIASIGGVLVAGGKAIADRQVIDAETNAQVDSIYASLEHRKEEWQLQKSLAATDIPILQQQITIAQDQQSIALKEVSIANIQAAQDRNIAQFLATKFTNAELYEWMSGVLAGVYRYFLQQATSMAQMAQSQLTFERQQRPPNFILSDYWEPPSDTMSGIITSPNNTSDRRGLTGSARLLQDIYQLDQYAFDTNKRKLNLTQSFSLSQLAPFEFQRFRETGLIQFATPMKLFDISFPGHYLRLIKSVRTSVIALIPPTAGIRASLTTSGVSRVVTGEDNFRTVVIRRDPDLVALTSPTNATGVFELDSQSDMLFPFESMGVDTLWELQMPKAANRFDYNTIADVIITIEYTALNSVDYRQQIIQKLDTKISADTTFSFRDDFPDQWYELLNPDQVEEQDQLVARFEIERADFPPNIDDLKLEQVIVYFSRTTGASFEVTTHLAQNRPTTNNDAASSVDGVISTRRGNWPGIPQLQSPVGKWELSFRSDNPAIDKENMSHFKNGDIVDIALFITYSGNSPGWPA